jgi:hypothetical protein
MIALVCFVLAILTSPFKSKSRLEAENAADHLRYLLRLAEMIDLGGKIQPPQRHAEQEPNSGHHAVAIANTHARLGQVQLEQANVLGRSRVGGAL